MSVREETRCVIHKCGPVRRRNMMCDTEVEVCEGKKHELPTSVRRIVFLPFTSVRHTAFLSLTDPYILSLTVSPWSRPAPFIASSDMFHITSSSALRVQQVLEHLMNAVQTHTHRSIYPASCRVVCFQGLYAGKDRIPGVICVRTSVSTKVKINITQVSKHQTPSLQGQIIGAGFQSRNTCWNNIKSGFFSRSSDWQKIWRALATLSSVLCWTKSLTVMVG